MTCYVKLDSSLLFEDSTLELTPELVGATETVNSGIIGETADLTIEHLADTRAATIHLKLAEWIVKRKMTNAGDRPNIGLIIQAKSIVRQWMADYLALAGGTQPAQLLYYNIADRVADRIMAAITRGQEGGGRVLAMLDPYNREGSTRHVSFMTSKDRYETAERCHINYAVIDSDWEAEFCRVADRHPRVLAWVKKLDISEPPDGLTFSISFSSRSISICPGPFRNANRRTPDCIASADLETVLRALAATFSGPEGEKLDERAAGLEKPSARRGRPPLGLSGLLGSLDELPLSYNRRPKADRRQSGR